MPLLHAIPVTPIPPASSLGRGLTVGHMTGDKDPTDAHTLPERLKAQAEGTVGMGTDGLWGRAAMSTPLRCRPHSLMHFRCAPTQHWAFPCHPRDDADLDRHSAQRIPFSFSEP